MKRLGHVLFLCCCLGIGLMGCEADNEEPKIITDISDDFYIDLWENLQLPARSLSLNVETIDDQDCKNTLLDFSSKRSNYSLTVSLNDILEPHPTECIEEPTSVKASINLGYLPEGKYDMQINLKNAVINEGILTVTEEAYTVSMYTNEGFHLRHAKLFRVPEDSYWGYVAYNDNALGSKAQDFVMQLKTISSELNPPLGYYGRFTVQPNGKIAFAQPPAANTIIPFFLGFEDSSAEVKAVLEEYRSGNSNLQLKIFTSDGEEW